MRASKRDGQNETYPAFIHMSSGVLLNCGDLIRSAVFGGSG
jgi:hypothetical protein